MQSVLADLGEMKSIAAMQAGVSGFAIIDVTVNPTGGTHELPQSDTEMAEILTGAYVAVVSPGALLKPIKAEVTSLDNFRKRVIVPVASGESTSATVRLVLGRSATCAYYANAATVEVSSGAVRTISLNTLQVSGGTTVVEIARVQPYTSTANDSGDSRILRRVTTANGTTTYYGHKDYNGNFVREAGVKIVRWTVPEDAASIADCTPQNIYGDDGDADIFTLLKVLGEEKIVDVTYTGDSAEVVNKFVRFPQVFVKTTFEQIPIPVYDANNELVRTDYQPSVVRWFCDVQADPDYHLHAAFVRSERNGDTFTERECPYCYISRYPLNNVTLRCNGADRAMAKSQADGSNEVGNTRAGFLDRCKNVNYAAITVSDPSTSETLLTIPAGSDPRAMGMADLQMISLVEDLAYLLFGVDSQSGLRGVSSGSAQAQQKNGVTDYIAALGVKLGGKAPTSAEYNFNFLDIEGGTWSAPGCMFANLTSIMERVTMTDASGVPTSTTRNRYIVAQDRLDYNPGSGDVESLTAAGYRYVSFNVSGKRRIGLDDTMVMRDAKLFCADQTTKNINYAGVDEHWQGGAPAAIANYSATATYAVNAYAIYDGKLYQCTTAVSTAEAFDSDKWELQTNKTIIARSYYVVARGGGRVNGSSLGAVCLYAYDGLSGSYGYGWRSRLSFLPLPAANDE